MSANVTFSMFVLPALRKVSGYVNPHLTTIKAKVSFLYVRNLRMLLLLQSACLCFVLLHVMYELSK